MRYRANLNDPVIHRLHTKYRRMEGKAYVIALAKVTG